MPQKDVPGIDENKLADEDQLKYERTEYELKKRTTEGSGYTAVQEELRLDLDEDEEKKLSREVLDHIEEIMAARNEYGLDELFQQWEDQYFGVVPEKDFPWPGSFNLHVPLTSVAVDTVDSVLRESVFGVRPIILIDPWKDTSIEVAKKKEMFLDYEFTSRMKLDEALDPVRFDAEVLGTGCAEVFWDKEIERIKGVETWKPEQLEEFLETYEDVENTHPEFVKELRQGNTVELVVEYNDTLFEGVKVRHINLADVIIHPETKPDMESLRKARLYGKQMMMRWDDLKRKEKLNEYEDVERVRTRSVEDGETEFLDDNQVKDEEFRVFSVTYRTDINDDGLEERVKIDIEERSGAVLRAISYPYWHSRPDIIPFYIQKRKNFFYGLGLAEMLQDLNDEANAIHNQTLDAGTISNAPSFKALKTAAADFNPYRDRWMPGKIWWLDDLNSVQEFNVGVSNGAQIFSNMEGVNTRWAELRTGSSQNLSGLESVRDPEAPARKTQTLIQQSLSRTGRYISTFQQGMVETAHQTLELNYQFSPDGRVFRVMHSPEKAVFPKISREEFRMRSDIKPHGSIDTFNKAQTKKDATELYTLLRQEPIIAENPLAVYELVRFVIENWGSNVDKRAPRLLPERKIFQEALARETGITALEPEEVVDDNEDIRDIQDEDELSAPPKPSGVGSVPPGLDQALQQAQQQGLV